METLELPEHPFDAGHVHGAAYRAEIQAFLHDQLARINLLRPSPLSRTAALAAAEAHGRVLAEDLPEREAELRGLAAGAQISYAEAVLLQYRRELAAHAAARDAHGCSLLACKLGGEEPVLAQTVDLEGNVAELVRVFRGRGRERPGFIMLSLAGLLGYLGMNDRGLCIGINMVLGGCWGHGVSPYLLVRQLLSCRDIEHALSEIARVRRSSSRSLTLLQGRRCVNVEMTPEALRISERLPSAHTNHFLHADFVAADRLNVFSKNSSKQRLAYLQDRIASGTLQSRTDVLGVLADHGLFPVGICMHAQGVVTRAETVAAVLMQPDRQAFVVRRGRACTAPDELHELAMRSPS